MAWTFNPFSGTFDQKGSGGGGGASYIDGEVATYADLPLDGSAALNSAWLVRTASGVWPVSRKQAGIYIRTATGGSNRDSDYTYAGTMPDVFSDAQFLIYDDANTARSMQVEITDNETLTFKVTGTDSVVRSVAFALSAIVLAALMASSAMAQNIGLVTDTNGNVVTRRTNTLVWSNNLRFTPLTNANSRTAIIGTNGALTAGNPPSAAAANGALLTADGAGSSAFAALALAGLSNVRILSATNSVIVTNSTTLVDAPIPSFTVAANKNYFIFAVAHFSNTNTGGFNFVMSAPSLDMVTSYQGPGIYWLGGSTTPSAMIANSSTELRVIQRAAAQPGPSMSIAVGAFRTGTNGGTAKFQFSQGTASTNTSTLHSNTQILIIEL
jgi:hypothetical protein